LRDQDDGGSERVASPAIMTGVYGTEASPPAFICFCVFCAEWSGISV